MGQYNAKGSGRNRFSRGPEARIQRSQLDLSHGHKTGVYAGWLYPVFVGEALPGDTFNLRSFSFGRMATPIQAVFENMYCDFFFFAVPKRLVWDNFVKMMGEQDNPADTTDYTVPQFVDVVVAQESLSDHMGLPLAGGNPISFNSLHHRAYNLIWNEWFRDQNLQDSVVVDKDDGPDDLADYVFLKRNKRHDYFSSALPFTQKGDPVGLPVGDYAPVLGLAVSDNNSFSATSSGTIYETGGPTTYNPWTMQVDASQDLFIEGDGSGNPLIRADLSAAVGTSINDFREALQIQGLLERDARGGTRYPETLFAHFGVISPDQRVQRPEYLGGGSVRINVNPVAVTAEGGTGARQTGETAAFATFSGNNIGFTKSFVEHCVLLGLMNIRADISYQQGIPKMFSRRNRYDYFWPALQHLGEQPIYSKEIFADGSASDDDIFGYQERYAEYKYQASFTTGVMRSDHAQSLDIWHLGLDFAARPTLNDTFMQDDPPFDRIMAVVNQPHFLVDMYFRIKAARPMAVRSVPGLISRF